MHRGDENSTRMRRAESGAGPFGSEPQVEVADSLVDTSNCPAILGRTERISGRISGNLRAPVAQEP